MVRTRKPSRSRLRYRAEHHAITAQLTNDEYEALDRIRKTDNVGWREILKRSLIPPVVDTDRITKEQYKQQLIDLEGKCRELEMQISKSQWSSIGHCWKCEAPLKWNLATIRDANELDRLLAKGMPVCPKCKASKTAVVPNKREGFFSRR